MQGFSAWMDVRECACVSAFSRLHTWDGRMRDPTHLGGRVRGVLDLGRVQDVHERGGEQQAGEAGDQARQCPGACMDRRGQQHRMHATGRSQDFPSLG